VTVTQSLVVSQSSFLFEAVTLIECDGFFVCLDDTQVDFMNPGRTSFIVGEKKASGQMPECWSAFE